MRADWNRFYEKLTEARRFLAMLYAEVYAKAMGTWPDDVDATEFDLASHIGRPRRGKILERLVWCGMHNVYAVLNMAWKLYRTDVRGEHIRLHPVHFEEFPVDGLFAKLLPGDGNVEDTSLDDADDRTISPTPIRISLQSALRKLNILLYRISTLPGVEPLQTVERPKGLAVSVASKPFSKEETETRLVQIYRRLNEAWNSRFDKTFVVAPDEIRNRCLFPREFLRLGGDAPEREQIKKLGCNLDLLRFHVTEAKGELESLLSEIKHAQGERLTKSERSSLVSEDFGVCRLSMSLSHAYHHLNFAWNGCSKTMAEADAQFSRNEKFPRHFDRYWSRSALTKRQR